MKELLSSLFSSQVPPPGAREGLPYWIFYTLLCIILLLVTFIFLRDKDLRQRLNSFFFSAKRQLIKLRLQDTEKKGAVERAGKKILERRNRG
jgi:predicted PurR-regulated permease PerM